MLLLALAGAALLATRWKRAGLRMVIGAVALLAMTGLLPVGTFLIHGLESRFPQWDATRGHEPVFNGSGSRMLAMAKLTRAYPNARIVYSGGDASLFGDGLRTLWTRNGGEDWRMAWSVSMQPRMSGLVWPIG